MNATPGRAPKRDDLASQLRAVTKQAADVTVAVKPAQMGSYTAEQLRTELVKLFKESNSVLNAFYDYSQKAAALAEEYHAAQFREKYAVPVEEITLACTLDARETPATLDKKLLELQAVPIRKILFDRARSTYYLFV